MPDLGQNAGANSDVRPDLFMDAVEAERADARDAQVGQNAGAETQFYCVRCQESHEQPVAVAINDPCSRSAISLGQNAGADSTLERVRYVLKFYRGGYRIAKQLLDPEFDWWMDAGYVLAAGASRPRYFATRADATAYMIEHPEGYR